MPWREKLRAFATHLALSALVVGSVLALVVLAWYPAPYFQALDVWQVVKIMIVVDLVLGPLLTLILYYPEKRTLVFDLSVVAIVQLAALVYGTMALYQERPYFMVFSGDHFEVLARDEVDLDNLEDPALGGKPLRGPRLLTAPLPNDPAEQTGLITAMMMGTQQSLHFEPAYWRRYEDGTELVAAEMQALESLAGISDTAARAVEGAVRRYGGEESALAYVPLRARGRDLALIVARENARPVDIVEVDPRAIATAAAVQNP